MKLFQVKTEPLGVERVQEFLEDNYVCIGYTGVGDLENAGKEEMRKRLVLTGTPEGAELDAALDHLQIFVHDMQDGDYVLITDEEWAYLGDLGDYFYADTYDSAEDGRCHRRGVTWLKSVPLAMLHHTLREWLTEAAVVSQYTGILPGARLDLWITESTTEGLVSGKIGYVEDELVAEALTVLKAALQSEDAERRERAAIAILQYAK
ncbi:hypothetical protein [Paenibacillus sp. P46E]|uniref:hypothetical protein n=1 Tax=Paenibacillus sp. P46E TaxID=1349436 RepID=UPI00093C8658|nr:hypothetical protein [Paenibacillus sp. P46E]OKP95581.1 hypothetical protein A3849_25435 [Paenibacillus sp. P46E]